MRGGEYGKRLCKKFLLFEAVAGLPERIRGDARTPVRELSEAGDIQAGSDRPPHRGADTEEHREPGGHAQLEQPRAALSGMPQGDTWLWMG